MRTKPLAVPNPVKRSAPTYTLTDHLCKGCGGRILMQASQCPPTGGGNPTYECADCGERGSGMGPDVLCWCGFTLRGQRATAYQCLPFSILEEIPEMRQEFGACGCDPNRKTSRVGIVTVDGARRAKQKAAERKAAGGPQ